MKREDTDEDIEIRLRIHPRNLRALTVGPDAGTRHVAGFRLRDDGAYEIWFRDGSFMGKSVTNLAVVD
jgi:hypothetical protein